MNLRKRVIESTIIAVMLTVVTAVTAVMQTAPVENVPEPQQETKAVADVQTDGSAGIIEELASLGDAATEQASIELSLIHICHVGGLISGFFLSLLLYRRKD